MPDGRRLKAPELPRFARSGRAASIREVLRVWIFFRSQLDAFNCNAVSFLMHAVVHCIGASYIKERYYFTLLGWGIYAKPGGIFAKSWR